MKRKGTTRVRLAIVIALAMTGMTLTASAVSQWWDTGTASGCQAGNAAWDTGVSAWASASGGTTTPGPWANGNDAYFTAGASTATVNGVTANSLNVSTFTVLNPGSGPLTINGGGVSEPSGTGNALLINAPVVLGANQLWNCLANATVTGQVSGAHTLSVCMNYYNSTWLFALTNNDNNSFGGLTILGAASEQYSARAWPQGNSTILGNGPITLSNAMLRLDNAGATAATVTITNLIAQGGSRLFIGNPNAALTTTVAGSDLVRSGHGQLIITTLTNSLASKEMLTLTGPTFALTNGIVYPWVARATSAAGMDPGDFVTYGGSGVSPAAYQIGFGAGSSTEVVMLTNATTTLSGSEQCYVFKMTNGTARTLDLHGNTLAVGDQSVLGAIMFANSGDIIEDTVGGGALNAGNADLSVFLGANPATIAVPISGTGGLTKMGSGMLTISNAALVGCDATINSGTLSLWPTANVLYTNNIVGAIGYTAGNLIKDGPNTLTLSNNTFYLGGTLMVQGGGTMILSQNTNTIINTYQLKNASTLVVTNGARLNAATLSLCGGLDTNNTIRVVGANTYWDVGLAPGNNSYIVYAGAAAGAVSNLIVIDGATASNTVGGICVGKMTGANYNGLIVTNGAMVDCNLNVPDRYGTGCGWNWATITGTNTQFGGGYLWVGYHINSGTSSNNWMVINGAQCLSGGVDLRVGGGKGSTGNALTLTNGAMLISAVNDSFQLGYHYSTGDGPGCSSNRILVTGTNTTWRLGTSTPAPGYIGDMSNSCNVLTIDNGASLTNAGGTTWALQIGNGAASVSNGLVVTNSGGFGGLLGNFGPGVTYIGYAASSTNNYVLVAGAGAQARLAGPVCVGYGGTACGNQLTVNNGGLVQCGSTVTIGVGNGASNNSVTINGGVLNAAGLTFSNAWPNTLTLTGPAVATVTNLMATNSNNQIAINGGTLNVKNVIMSNGVPFVVGDGSQAAGLNMLAGGSLNALTNAFWNGVVITNNATLSGAGVIQATTTVYGAVSPGAPVGVLTNLGPLTLVRGAVTTIAMATNITAGTSWSLLCVTNGTLTLGGRLQVLLTTNYVPSKTDSFLVMTNTQPLIGSASSFDSQSANVYTNLQMAPVGTLSITVGAQNVLLGNFSNRSFRGTTVFIQ